MKNNKNGVILERNKKEAKRVAALIAPLYFFALFIAGLVLALIFK